jgi:Xaa-Pro aminopeptidase
MDKTRSTKLKNLLKENNIDAALISSLANIVHLTNFSYFTDIEREGFLLITKTNQYIFTDGRYTHAVKKYIKNFELRELKASESLINHLQQIFEKEQIKILGIEEDNITVKEYSQLKKIAKTHKHFTFHKLRIEKDSDEMIKIKKACELGDKAFSYILQQIKFGMTEKEIAFLLETFMRKNNADPSFSSIVAFGENAAVPHHKTGNTRLKKNDLILLDFGVKYDNYCSDMTRTVFFGEVTSEQKKVYETVRVAQEKAISYIEQQLKNKQLVKAANTDKTARDFIIKKGYPSFSHSLGHGIGLQVHEAPHISPKSKDILTEGMVFSIEPGIYLPDNMGVRIEDLFAIQNDKLIKLTNSSRTLTEIPAK